MKHTLITFAVALCCGFVGSASAAGAGGMDKAAYKAQKDQIQADYKAAKDKCGPLKGNAQDICKAEAKGKHDVAKAELEEQYKPSPRNEAKVENRKGRSRLQGGQGEMRRLERQCQGRVQEGRQGRLHERQG